MGKNFWHLKKKKKKLDRILIVLLLPNIVVHLVWLSQQLLQCPVCFMADTSILKLSGFDFIPPLPPGPLTKSVCVCVCFVGGVGEGANI